VHINAWHPIGAFKGGRSIVSIYSRNALSKLELPGARAVQGSFLFNGNSGVKPSATPLFTFGQASAFRLVSLFIGFVAILLLMLTPEKAHAHGAWLGNCQVDFSGATIAEIQASVDSGEGGVKNNDFIEYISNCPVIISGTLSGPGGYVTFYKPNGTEIAGAWIVNSAGTPISARPATSAVSGEGISRGWGPQLQKTFNANPGIGWNPSSTAVCSAAGFTTANCNAGLAYVYGDTGIFYSTRSDTAMFSGGASTITVTNGYETNPTNSTPWGTVGGTGNERVHNKWDAVQTNAFGATSVISNGFPTADETRLNTAGRGTTPFNAGSPVAGPDSGLSWDRYGLDGPWNRISYAGSCFANDTTIAGTEGPANGIGSVFPQAVNNTANSVSVCTPTSAGVLLADAALLPTATNALRFAVGGITSGETKSVKVRLKVTNIGTMGFANFEGHGGDSTQGVAAGNDNPWRYWIGAPGSSATASARLFVNKKIVAVNGAAYNGTSIPPGATLRYRVSYASAYTSTQTNVVLSDILPTQATGTSNYTVVSGANIVPAVLPSSGTFNFQAIANLLPGQGGVVEFDVATSATAGQTVTNTIRINSTQLPTLQTDIVATLVVTPPAVVAANDGATGINGTSGANNVVNAFTGDTIGGSAANASNATLSIASGSSVPAGLTFDLATGNVSVAAATPAGSYSFVYQICELGSTTNCKTATVSITVVLPPVTAIDDSVTGINSATGAANVLNAFTGDLVNGVAATSVNATLALAPAAIVPAGLTFDTATGTVSVAAGTPAGNYSFDYQLCDIVSSASCDIGTINVEVLAAPLVAGDDSVTGINGTAGGINVINAFAGDTLNGTLADATNTTLALAVGSTVPVGLTFDTATGNVSVAAGTAAGSYSFDYTICEILNPGNCKTATITVGVTAGILVSAVNDTVTGINGVIGATNALNLRDGDTVNGAPATIANTTLSVATGSSVPTGLTFDTASGIVAVAPGTLAGTYSFDYQICSTISPTTCKVATASVTVSPSVDLVVAKTNGTTSVTSGDTTTYTLSVTNNGPDAAIGAIVSDAPGSGLTCPVTNAVAITGDGIPAGSFTIANLTGAGITLGTLASGQTATLTYSCQVN
jgi:uncharacterized repeat protein (TIGR01451 family)